MLKKLIIPFQIDWFRIMDLKIKERVIIDFLAKEGCEPKEIHNNLKDVLCGRCNGHQCDVRWRSLETEKWKLQINREATTRQISHRCKSRTCWWMDPRRQTRYSFECCWFIEGLVWLCPRNKSWLRKSQSLCCGFQSDCKNGLVSTTDGSLTHLTALIWSLLTFTCFDLWKTTYVVLDSMT